VGILQLSLYIQSIYVVGMTYYNENIFEDHGTSFQGFIPGAVKNSVTAENISDDSISIVIA
jgi:uncharacterized protein YqhQ